MTMSFSDYASIRSAEFILSRAEGAELLGTGSVNPHPE